MLLQVTFVAKWRLKTNHNYVWTTCGILINLRTSKIVKKTTNGKGIKAGYYINRKFVKIEDLKNQLEVLPTSNYNFK
ncbi:hypothetical protein [Polaribacter aestuariivivens]|uniref:hypothetical protein n=1 Tax=Polaribacter aestuariivivens TaxID=2304626 RepID=UPI003F491704